MDPADVRELDRIVELGIKFRAQQRKGRRRGFLYGFVESLVKQIGAGVTFENLLDAMETEAARRNLDGERASPVESVNRVWELVKFHIPGKGVRQVPFGTLRNVLTTAKKICFSSFTGTAKP